MRDQRRRSTALSCPLGTDLGRLSGALTQIINLALTHPADGGDFELADPRAVHGKDPLYADPVRGLANGEGLSVATATATQTNPFKHLNTLFLTLFDQEVNLERITRSKMGQIVFELAAANFIEHIHIELRALGSRATAGIVFSCTLSPTAVPENFSHPTRAGMSNTP